MSPRLKVLSGKDAVKIFEHYGFVVVRTKGSHVRMENRTASTEQHITIPLHAELKKGTIKAIFNQASRFVSSEELENHFYTK